MSDHSLLWTVIEPRGLRVSLATDVWEHVQREHPEIVSYEEAIRLTVENPDEIYFDSASTAKRKPGTQVFAYYKSKVLAGVLSGNFVYVSVKFVTEAQELHGFVQTAFATRNIQKRMALQWKK